MIRQVKATIVLREAAIGGEVVRISREAFNSPFKVEAWIIKPMGQAGILSGSQARAFPSEQCAT
jgi:hypothetical protein